VGAPNFNELLSDITGQPNWRGLSDRCTGYYDHQQFTPAQRKKLQSLGMPDIVENLIQPTINSVLGHEAQRRRDWMVKADDDDSQEVAEALNQKLNEALRLTEANSRCSDAYASQIKAGIGWLHIRRGDNDLAGDYAIDFVHRDEIYWDLRDRSQDLKDCRWMARRRFADVDEAKAFIPAKFHKLIEGVAKAWSLDSDEFEFVSGTFPNRDFYSEWNAASGNIEHLIDSQRRRVAIYEVYYRSIDKVRLLKFTDGMVEEFDKNNPQHMIALLTNQATAKINIVKRMRRRWFVGPHLITDEISPYPHDYFPYVPFFGYREDKSNIPYGLIRAMIDPQDAYNNCNVRIHHILNAKTLIMTEDATDMPHDDVQHEGHRKDGRIILRNGKTYGHDLIFKQDWQELQKLEGLKLQHEQKIRDCAGIYQNFSGKEAGAQSGVAIASLAELGAVTLSEINDNYEYARKKVAELMLAYIVHDLADKPEVVSITNDHAQNKKYVVLNDPREGQLDNMVQRAKYQVTLASVQTTAGYRQHQHTRMMEMYTSSPDNVKMMLLPMVIESSEMPRREEFLKKWNEAQGIVDDPEQQAQQQQIAQQRQQEELEILKAERMAKVSMMQSQAKERNAEAELNQAQAAEKLMQIELLKIKVETEEDEVKAKMIKEMGILMKSKSQMQ
jgi:hypothetical protein